MTNREIIDGNIIIAKWLDWEVEEDYVDTPFLIYQPEISNIPEEKWDCAIKFEKLNFHNDSNWQWLALENIMKIENNCSLSHVIRILDYMIAPSDKIKTKQELFETILKYINNEKICKDTFKNIY